MTRSKLVEFAGGQSLIFACGDLPADETIIAAGHEPNGYFWEGIATLLAPDLVAKLELDSEADMFSAVGPREELLRLQSVLEPHLDDADAVRVLIERAEAQGFQFDD